jgi:hypothetical protein
MGTAAWEASHSASMMSGFQLIHLGDDARGAAIKFVLHFAMDEIEQPRPHGQWSDQKRGAVGLVCMPGEIVKEIDNIICNSLVAGE